MQRALASSSRRAAVVRPPSVTSSSSLGVRPRGAVVAVVAPRRRSARAPPCRASADDGGESAPSSSSPPASATTTAEQQQHPQANQQQQPQPQQPQRRKRQADSTDAVASFLTRRFGIAGGLAWLGVLTFGVVSEQLKTRRELREESEGTRDASAAAPERPLPGLGASYRELRVGGGARPQRGDLVVLEFSARYSADGGLTYADPPFADTRAKKPVVLVWGARPLAAVIAPAVEAAVADGMRAGGRRVVTIAEKGAGGFGASPPPGVPQGGVALQYDVTLSRVSVAPS